MKKNNSLFAFFSATILVIILFFYSLSIYFGNNPLNNNLLAQLKIISILPQGWAFFTRNSKEPRLYTFLIKNGGLTELSLRNFSSKYYFGISRFNRVLNLEINSIFKNINKDSVFNYEYKSINIENLAKNLNLNTLKFNNIAINRFSAPNFYGRYVLIMQIMLPWPLLHKEPNSLSHFIVYPVDVTYND